MKIVQSFWSKPFYEPTSEKVSLIEGYKEDLSTEQWKDRKFFCMAWAFSCLQLRKFYDEVELITDEKGKELLIDKLKLPYTSIRVELDTMNKYESFFWVVGKLHAYQHQDQPFLHVDGDLFIWEKFGDWVKQSSLIALHIENYIFYREMYDAVIEGFSYVPALFNNGDNDKLYGANMGIVGGRENSFFNEYATEAFKFIESNVDILRSKPLGLDFNPFLEQFIFSRMAENRYEVDYYIDREQPSLYSLAGVPSVNKLVHARSDYRDHSMLPHQLYHAMLKEYPSYYYRIMKAIIALEA